MAYSKWTTSRWWVFPSTSHCIECYRHGDARYTSWLPAETYEEFLSKAKSTFFHNEKYDKDIAELQTILEKNLADIQKWFDLWRK